MGFGGIGIWQLLIILVIVVLLFGTKKLRNIGGDLGGAVKNFKGAIKDAEKEPEEDDVVAEKLKHEEGDAEFSEKTSEKDKV